MIRGQVARVLTTRELVINRGNADGVGVGMRFAVLDPKADNIRDPETGEVLGSVSRPKVNVEVTRVEKRLSLAATYRTRRVNVGGQGAGISALGKLFEPPEYVDEFDTFKASDQSWQELDESESFVKVGDPVVQLGEREQELQTQANLGQAGAMIANGQRPKASHPSSPARRARRSAALKEGSTDGGQAPEAAS
jgi:hypothetical protein